MSSFVPTYLYVKRHLKTGLFYLGKTIKNPKRYMGSGLYWRKHLKTHGNYVETLWFKLFDNQKECTEVALKLSKWFNIIESNLWANLKYENGIDGGSAGMVNPKGMLGKNQTTQAKTAQSKSKLGNLNPNFGKKYTVEERKKFGHPGSKHHMYNKRHSIDTREKMCNNRPDYTGSKNPMYGKKHTTETLEKLAKPKIKICRLCDHKEMSVNHFTRWLNSGYKGELA